jgi:hypothetical protein
MFALYSVHGNMLHMFGYRFPHMVWNVVGGREAQGLVGYVADMVVGWGMNLVLALWAADVFAREVDGRLSSVLAWFQGISNKPG